MTTVARLLATLEDIIGVPASAEVIDDRVHVSATTACGRALDAGWLREASLATDAGFRSAVDTFSYGLTCSCSTCQAVKRGFRHAEVVILDDIRTRATAVLALDYRPGDEMIVGGDGEHGDAVDTDILRPLEAAAFALPSAVAEIDRLRAALDEAGQIQADVDEAWTYRDLAAQERDFASAQLKLVHDALTEACERGDRLAEGSSADKEAFKRLRAVLDSVDRWGLLPADAR